MPHREELERLAARIVTCRRCPRLVEWRERVAVEKRAAFADQQYWGRPVPGFGDPGARIVIVGLAPAAHGGNRTGRVFTGDRSGDFLFRALYRCGLASQPTSVARGDGLRLRDAYLTAVNRCAPPDNKPTPRERDNCLPYLADELMLLDRGRAVVCLGSFAWDGVLRALAALGNPVPRPKPKFGHEAEATIGPYFLLGCFHPSQQNTFTGKLTPDMLEASFRRAKEIAGVGTRLSRAARILVSCDEGEHTTGWASRPRTPAPSTRERCDGLFGRLVRTATRRWWSARPSSSPLRWAWSTPS